MVESSAVTVKFSSIKKNLSAIRDVIFHHLYTKLGFNCRITCGTECLFLYI